jgi:hypothetical protein
MPTTASLEVAMGAASNVAVLVVVQTVGACFGRSREPMAPSAS